MPWQKIERHISDQQLIVESRDGNTYPVDTEYDWIGEEVYTQLVSNGTPDDVVMWAWVEFEDYDKPTAEYTKRQRDGDGYPGAPPWEHP